MTEMMDRHFSEDIQRLGLLSQNPEPLEAFSNEYQLTVPRKLECEPWHG